MFARGGGNAVGCAEGAVLVNKVLDVKLISKEVLDRLSLKHQIATRILLNLPGDGITTNGVVRRCRRSC